MKKVGLFAAVGALVVLITASEAVAVTGWQTKASVYARTAVQNASASATVDVYRPYSLRVLVRTPGHKQTVSVSYSVFCVTTGFSTGSKSGQFSLALTGTTTWAIHTIPKPLGTWAQCSVNAFTVSHTTGGLAFLIQERIR
jgi:hypothetical protein